MIFSIKEILSKFKVKKSTSSEINDVIKEYFEEKNITITGNIKATLTNKKISIFGDPYVTSYVRLNKSDILLFIQNKLPFYKIEDLN